MLEKQSISKPLSLKGAYNVRDLGVYTNINGEKLIEKQVLRGDGLHSLTDEDKSYLKEYGVEVVIDLRSSFETEKLPCVLREIDYYSIPLLDNINSGALKGNFPNSLSELYIDLLENSKDEICKILRIISGYPNKCVIFNCTAGKDRTGIIAMLILELAYVDEDVIVRDYAVSEKYLDRLLKGQKDVLKKSGIEVPESVFNSKPIEMEKAINHLKTNYKSVKEYIKSIGLSEEEILSIKNKLIAGN